MVVEDGGGGKSLRWWLVGRVENRERETQREVEKIGETAPWWSSEGKARSAVQFRRGWVVLVGGMVDDGGTLGVHRGGRAGGEGKVRRREGGKCRLEFDGQREMGSDGGGAVTKVVGDGGPMC